MSFSIMNDMITIKVTYIIIKWAKCTLFTINIKLYIISNIYDVAFIYCIL